MSHIRSHIEYSCAHFVVEIDEKSSHNGGFKYDLMMISDSGLLFWATCICATWHKTNIVCSSILQHAAIFPSPIFECFDYGKLHTATINRLHNYATGDCRQMTMIGLQNGAFPPETSILHQAAFV